MLKDIKIDNRTERVFVLTENAERVCYISLKTLHRIDYERLMEISKKFDDKMLEGMKDTTLSNGRNALRQYDNLIQVAQKGDKNAASRIAKPNEPKAINAVHAAEPAVTVIEKTVAPLAPRKSRGNAVEAPAVEG